MATKLWKELLFGATVFCRQLMKGVMQGFGFKAEKIVCDYAKGYHYYSYLWFKVAFVNYKE